MSIVLVATITGCISKAKQAEILAHQGELATTYRADMEAGFDRAVAAVRKSDLKACAG